MATPDVSRLYFPQSNQLIEGTTPDLIEAALGLPIGVADFSQLAMGCPQIQSEARTFRLGTGWRRVSHEHDQWYLHRSTDEHPWTLVAFDHLGAPPSLPWRARFLEQQPNDTAPRRLRVTSLDGNGTEGRRFDVHLVFSAFQQRPAQPFGEEGLWIPASATRTTIENVKQQWPLVALAQSR